MSLLSDTLPLVVTEFGLSAGDERLDVEASFGTFFEAAEDILAVEASIVPVLERPPLTIIDCGLSVDKMLPSDPLGLAVGFGLGS